MKVNRLLNDVIRGDWLLSFRAMEAYAPIGHKILLGEEVELQGDTQAFVSIVNSNYQKVESQGWNDIPPNSVAIIRMVGPVIKYGDFCTYGADEIANALTMADENPNIIGIVLYVDGPGGSVSAVGPFEQFAKTKTKRVEVVLDQCCSLHYWVACMVGDYKTADNTTSATIGSVGVMTSFVDNRKYLETLGYQFHEIYPDESLHKNEAMRLALEGKYDMIKEEHLSPIALQFQAVVRANCPNLKEEVGVLTGKTFSATKALEYGMIDGIGSVEDAVRRIQAWHEIKTSNF